jgi:hypothetical protein
MSEAAFPAPVAAPAGTPANRTGAAAPNIATISATLKWCGFQRVSAGFRKNRFQKNSGNPRQDAVY